MVVRNFTTQIPADKTLMEIEGLLVRYGAKGIYKEYLGSRVNSLMFFIEKDNRRIPFKIPLSIEKSRRIIESIVKEGKLPKKFMQEPLRTEQGEVLSSTNKINGGNKMSEIVLRNAVKREQGWLYFVDKDGNVARAKMQHKGRPKKAK